MSPLVLAAGLAVGLGLGALGSGGSMLAVPALIYLLGLDPYAAVSGSLVVVGVSAAAGAVAHGRAGRVRLRVGLTFGLLGTAGSVAGSWLSAAVGQRVLLLAFAALALATAVVVRRRPGRSRPSPPSAAGRLLGWRAVVAASLVGLVTGFLGVGGGFLLVPALLLVVGLPLPVAVGTSLVAITVNSATALAARWGQDSALDWPVLAGFAGAAVVGCLLGARAVARVRPERLSTMLSAALVAVGLYMGFRGLA